MRAHSILGLSAPARAGYAQLQREDWAAGAWRALLAASLAIQHEEKYGERAHEWPRAWHRPSVWIATAISELAGLRRWLPKSEKPGPADLIDGLIELLDQAYYAAHEERFDLAHGCVYAVGSQLLWLAELLGLELEHE